MGKSLSSLLPDQKIKKIKKSKTKSKNEKCQKKEDQNKILLKQEIKIKILIRQKEKIFLFFLVLVLLLLLLGIFFFLNFCQHRGDVVLWIYAQRELCCLCWATHSLPFRAPVYCGCQPGPTGVSRCPG